MPQNANLHQAKKAKQDEFYTQLADIEAELVHYKKHFGGKTILCNCDDPQESRFSYYFERNFDHLKLARLITTGYKNAQGNLFSLHDDTHGCFRDYRGTPNPQGIPSADDIDKHTLEGDGDFRSQECIELLQQADIVVTNPPFSLFREYVAQLVEYDKEFLIIGSMNAITYKEIFPLIRDNKMWLGVTPRGRDMLFDIPKDYAQELVATKREGSAYRMVDGVIKGRLGNAAWFTNLDYSQRHENLILYKPYTPADYPTYDNYDAIEVGKTADIPADYDGAMGVPISFLDKHNPDQFEIVGMGEDNGRGHSGGLWLGGSPSCLVNGKAKFKRLFIRRKE